MNDALGYRSDIEKPDICVEDVHKSSQRMQKNEENLCCFKIGLRAIPKWFSMVKIWIQAICDL